MLIWGHGWMLLDHMYSYSSRCCFRPLSNLRLPPHESVCPCVSRTLLLSCHSFLYSYLVASANSFLNSYMTALLYTPTDRGLRRLDFVAGWWHMDPTCGHRKHKVGVGGRSLRLQLLLGQPQRLRLLLEQPACIHGGCLHGTRRASSRSTSSRSYPPGLG